MDNAPRALPGGFISKTSDNRLPIYTNLSYNGRVKMNAPRPWRLPPSLLYDDQAGACKFLLAPANIMVFVSTHFEGGTAWYHRAFSVCWSTGNSLSFKFAPIRFKMRIRQLEILTVLWILTFKIFWNTLDFWEKRGTIDRKSLQLLKDFFLLVN